MAKKKLAFSEGDWFNVPLRRGKHAIGLVARKDRGGDAFLGYYFPPGDPDETAEQMAARLTPSNAVLICASGTYGLRHELWRMLGSATWRRSDWPIPVFQHTNAFGQTFLETYGDEDVLLPIRVQFRVVDPRIPAHVVKGGLLDAGAVEDALWDRLRSQLLGPRSSST